MRRAILSLAAAATAVLVVPQIASATPVPACQWSGFYGGVQAGYDTATTREYRAAGPDSTRWRSLAEGPFGGLFAGYDRTFGNWLGGVELEGNLNNLVAHYYDRDFGGIYYSQGWSWAGRLRLGYLASPSTLLYASVGITQADLDYSHGYWPSQGYVTPDQALTGMQLGAGIETFVTPNVSVRMEGVFSHLGSDKIYSADSLFAGSELNTLAVRAGVAFHPGWLGQPATAHTAPVARSWSGAYVGAHVGGVLLGSREDEDPNQAPQYNPAYEVGNVQPAFGGYAGYNWQFGRFVTGIEAEGAWLNASIPFGTTGDDRSQSWAAALRARLGVVANNTLLYATAGLAAGGFDDRGFGSDYTGTALVATGLQVGAGAEAFLTSRISARVEGVYSDFGIRVADYADAPVWRFEPRTFEARLGVTYHLN